MPAWTSDRSRGRLRTTDRGPGDLGEARRCLDEIDVGRGWLAIGELSGDPPPHGRGYLRDVIIGGAGRRMENGRSADGKAVNPIEEQRVKMRAGTERRVESLNHRHGAGLEKASDAEPPRPAPQPRRDNRDELAQHDGCQRRV